MFLGNVHNPYIVTRFHCRDGSVSNIRLSFSPHIIYSIRIYHHSRYISLVLQFFMTSTSFPPTPKFLYPVLSGGTLPLETRFWILPFPTSVRRTPFSLDPSPQSFRFTGFPSIADHTRSFSFLQRHCPYLTRDSSFLYRKSTLPRGIQKPFSLRKGISLYRSATSQDSSSNPEPRGHNCYLNSSGRSFGPLVNSPGTVCRSSTTTTGPGPTPTITIVVSSPPHSKTDRTHLLRLPPVYSFFTVPTMF